MGNQCPQGFQLNPTTPFTCVVQCPAEKGFTFLPVNGVPSCVYKDDNSYAVNLLVAPGVEVKEGESLPTVEELQTKNPAAFQKYKEAQSDFDTKFPVVYSQIEKQIETTNAFKELQAAENARDQSPEAYQAARVRYYTLVKGEDWVDEEKQRVAAAEVAPAVSKYEREYSDLTSRISQQQKTIDLATSVKDKILSVRDEMRYSANTFSKQIDDLRNQINLERKKHEEEKLTSTWSWFDIFLNVLLIFVSVYVIYILFKKMTTPKPYPTTTFITQ